MPRHPEPTLRLGIILVLLAAAVAYGSARTGTAERIDLPLVDRVASWLAPAGRDLVVVAIDQQSLERLGRWPWPRETHAALIERLAAAAPAVIGYDVLFAEPTPGDGAGDSALVAAVERAGNVVLPIIAEPPSRGLPPLEILPFGDLPQVAAALGHSHLAADPDGRLRRLPLRAGVGDPYWPALARAIKSVVEAEAGPNGDTAADASTSGFLGWVSVDEVLVPIPAAPWQLRHFSAADILARSSPPEIQDAVVLVGATAYGLKEWVDIGPSGSSARAPPVYFNAFAVEALLAERTLAAVRAPGPVAALLAAVAFAPWLAAVRAGRRWQRAMLVLAPLVPLAIGMIVLVVWRLVLPFGSVALSVLGLVLLAMLVGSGQRLRQARLERSLAHTALTNVADAVLTTNRAKIVDYANPAAERLFAVEPGQLAGRCLAAVAPEIDKLLASDGERARAEVAAGDAAPARPIPPAGRS